MRRSSQGQRAREITELPKANKSTTGVDRKTFGSQQINRMMEKQSMKKADLSPQKMRDYVNDRSSKLDDIIHGGS